MGEATRRTFLLKSGSELIQYKLSGLAADQGVTKGVTKFGDTRLFAASSDN